MVSLGRLTIVQLLKSGHTINMKCQKLLTMLVLLAFDGQWMRLTSFPSDNQASATQVTEQSLDSNSAKNPQDSAPNSHIAVFTLLTHSHACHSTAKKYTNHKALSAAHKPTLFTYTFLTSHHRKNIGSNIPSTDYII